MPRARRYSFPAVHSLYLSHAQDTRLRRFATKTNRSVSEIMRAALNEYLAGATSHRRREPNDEPSPADTRHAIAESARARKFARPPRNAGVWPNQQVADRTQIWTAPPAWPAEDAAQPYPLAYDHQGHPFEPPPNAVAWLALHQAHATAQPVPLTWRGSSQHVLIALETSRVQLIRLLGRRPGWWILHPVDNEGRLLKTKQGVVAA